MAVGGGRSLSGRAELPAGPSCRAGRDPGGAGTAPPSGVAEAWESKENMTLCKVDFTVWWMGRRGAER